MHHRALAFLATSATVAALALMLALGAAVATRTVTIASHLSIKGKGLTFSGSVGASNAACRAARRVSLYRTPSLLLGSVTTKHSGGWKLTVSGSAGITLGRFYAKVKARSEGTAGTIYVCKGATSKTIPYTP